MKNKKATYILLFAVVAIWGAVIVRIINHIRKPNLDTRNNSELLNKQENDMMEDTVIALNLNYPDPFLKYSISTESSSNTRTTHNSSIQQRIDLENKVAEPIVWPEIQFSGIVANNKTNEKLGLLLVNNQSYLVKSGDIKEQVQVNQVYPDSIVLVYKSQKQSFPKISKP